MTHDRWHPDTLQARLNSYAPYSGAGIVVTHIAADASEIRVEMQLTESNPNLVGTHFGGSLYSMVDPHLMILLMHRLGRDYVVWDKEALIDFRRPGTGTVSSTIRITDEELTDIRSATADGAKHLPQWTLAIVSGEDEVIATVLKTLYVRRASPAFSSTLTMSRFPLTSLHDEASSLRTVKESGSSGEAE
jgi:acyl-coenzyme A thioesterase PaaI-like protein